MDTKDIKKALDNSLDKINGLWRGLDIPKKKEEIEKLQKETEDNSFWNDREKAESTLKELNSLKELVKSVEELKLEIESNIEVLKLLEIEIDNNLYEEIVNSTNELQEKVEKLNILLMLNGPYDKNDCILEIHPGAGGTESCDWASMLYRMYLRWCEKKKYKVEILDYQDGEEAGIKSVSLLIKGLNAYGYLKNEKGVHRLVRLSPFDSNNRRHTSFASVEITPEIEQDNTIEIDEKDLKIDVYRSTGAGGQGVNTTDSAVRITHLPTKIVVTCQNERSQIQNKEQALKVLKNKLMLRKIEEQEEELNKIKGIQSNIDFGSQIRSYVMHPYSMVKDHRTNIETSNVSKVLDGDIDLFIESNLKKGL
ncbi:MAG: peptide chain release factor 2 [Bacilli bacterium]|nr:peptide chain release factor 2 [Bacilli bacterium]